MSRGILARKVGMTQLFTERGTVVPVTVLEAGPCRVVQRKTTAVDGYEALQIGFGERSPKRTPKPLIGHLKRAGLRPMRTLVELRDAGEAGIGSEITAEIFTAGDRVDVTGVSKGKGFAGQHKRHNFSRGPVSHGSHNIRQPGSIGSVDAARTLRGLKMAGHLGASRSTVKGLEVVRVDAARNLLMLKGAVPGSRNGVVLIRDADRQATL
ncbi:MAG: ribosomal protein [Chloroflexi bacterium]|jgi:large subunit ribosomal protein L3|nr:ribosomal protein [Chloroflexota bacterium]MEA2615142.1 large subunit ribosomal protein [Chloroflexota bacterium]